MLPDRVKTPAGDEREKGVPEVNSSYFDIVSWPVGVAWNVYIVSPFDASSATVIDAVDVPLWEVMSFGVAQLTICAPVGPQ